jgi:hypothetical protein
MAVGEQSPKGFPEQAVGAESARLKEAATEGYREPGLPGVFLCPAPLNLGVGRLVSAAIEMENLI